VHGTAKAGAIMRAVHVLKQVMHRNYVPTGQTARRPEKMGNVHQIAPHSLQQIAAFKVSGNRGIVFVERLASKILW
jgi:hypothetical protein